MNKKKAFLGLLLLPLVMQVEHAQGASFDCSKASFVVEKAVCGDAELSALDDALARAYKRAIEAPTDGADAIRAAQKVWIVKSRECANDGSSVNICLKSRYSERISQLEGVKPEAPTSPQQGLQTAADVPTLPAKPNEAPIAASLEHGQQAAAVEQPSNPVPPVQPVQSAPTQQIASAPVVETTAATDVGSSFAGPIRAILAYSVPLLGIVFPLLLRRRQRLGGRQA